MEGTTDIAFVTGAGLGPNSSRLTAHRYIEEILAKYVVPFGGYIGDHLMLIQDYARQHIACITLDYLKEVNIPVLDCPVRSQDSIQWSTS